MAEETKGVATIVSEDTQAINANDVVLEDRNDEGEHTETSSPTEEVKGTEDAKPGILQIETHHEADEVVERLFAMPDTSSISKEVSGLWGWMSGESATLVSKAAQIAETATQIAETATKKAEAIADQTKRVATAVMKNAEDSHKEFENEKERFMHEAIDPETEQVPFSPDTVLLPWEPESEYSDAIKSKVLALSKDVNSFLIPPPEAVDFVFSFDDSAPLALKLLEADSELNSKRFKMVPKEVKETVFWRNYFYRVNLIMEAYGKTAYTLSKANPDSQKDQNEGGQQEGSLPSSFVGEAPAQGPNGDTHGSEMDAKGDALALEDDDVESADKDAWEDELDDDLDFDEENFDMLNEELLGESEVSDAEVDDDLEARINAELSLMDD